MTIRQLLDPALPTAARARLPYAVGMQPRTITAPLVAKASVYMANLTSLLRDEITRLARRQINAEIVPLKKRWAQQRRVIAALKEECSALRRELSQLSQRGTTVAPKAPPRAAEGGATRRRFRADGLRSFRVRLGLTVREVALLLGVSEQTIYNWETASTRPQPAMIDTIAQLRALGKREVKARLLELQDAK